MQGVVDYGVLGLRRVDARLRREPFGFLGPVGVIDKIEGRPQALLEQRHLIGVGEKGVKLKRLFGVLGRRENHLGHADDDGYRFFDLRQHADAPLEAKVGEIGHLPHPVDGHGDLFRLHENIGGRHVLRLRRRRRDMPLVEKVLDLLQRVY